MNWVEIIWSAGAAMVLTIGVMHLLVWARARQWWANLLFALACLAIVACAGFELALMHSRTVEHFGFVQRWMHLPSWAVVVSVVWFFRSYLHAGRLWLVLAACGMQTLATIVNFACNPNLNFREITHLQPVLIWGQTVPAPVGVTNPLVVLGELSSLLMFAVILDASISAWRRGNRGALFIGGTVALAVLLATVQAALLVRGVIPMPYFSSLFFVAVALVMGYGLSSDVFHAAQLSRELHENEERMNLAAKATGLGIWEWDIAKDAIWISKQSRARLGSEGSGSLKSEALLNAVHPEDRESLRQSMSRAVSHDGDYECEYRLARPEGGYRWIVARARPEFNGSGKAVRLLGVSLDITDRKAAEESSRASEELNRTILASLDSHIAILNREGVIIAVNEAWVKFAREQGLPATGEDFGVGVSYLDVCRRATAQGDEMAALALEGIESVGTGGRDAFEMIYRCDSLHKSKWFVLRALPLRRAEGGVLISHTDITGRKLAELEVQQKRDELAHLSRVAALGELSGSMAHELNQPLTAILSNAQAAQRFLGVEPPDLNEVREILKDIVDDDRRAGEIIRRLRLLLQDGEANHQPMDLNDMVKEVLKLLRHDLISRNIQTQTILSPHLPPVRGDVVQLQQVVLNLIMNGCQAMRTTASSERKLVLCTERLDEQGVSISVRDQGCGIPPEVLPRVFEPFFSTRPGGMGMGLAVCRTIIGAHHGRLWAENNPDRGATFRFTIPVTPESGCQL